MNESQIDLALTVGASLIVIFALLAFVLYFIYKLGRHNSQQRKIYYKEKHKYPKK